jgi:hypothetical protein
MVGVCGHAHYSIVFVNVPDPVGSFRKTCGTWQYGLNRIQHDEQRRDGLRM